MADLDHLREINNTYGHLAGDIAIQGVANILRRYCRSEQLVARFGGEEFAILMPKTQPHEALAIVEAMRRAVEKSVFDAGNGRRKFQVTMSFGVTEWLSSDATVKDVIEQADQALYQAKSLGRNRACLYTPEPHGAAPDLVSAPAAAPLPPLLPAREAQKTADAALPAADTAAIESGEEREGAEDDVEAAAPPAQPPAQPPAWRLYAFIALLTVINGLLSLLLLRESHAPDWFGITLFAALAVAAELANVEIYARQTSVSTSAAALLAGVLIFGPPAALCIGPAIAAATWFKYRSPLVRFWFNANNHILGGLLCAGIIVVIGRPLAGEHVIVQVIVAVVCAVALYLSSTFLVAQAIALGSGQSWRGIWTERFRWLGLHYVALGLVAFGMAASYPTIGAVGITLLLLPLIVIRYGQKQYISATEAMVLKLQQTNADLMQQKQAVEHLNQEMLDLLAAAVDLRNHSVQSHSTQVARYATDIARHMGLPESQVEQVRKAALLHDIGKLAIPDHILYKSASLTAQEYAAIQQHPVVGAELLARFSSFRRLTPFVLHHHEHYDGGGYPDRLAGVQIPLEARIVGLADAVEAMASRRPYQPPMPADAIKGELRRCAGTQFDPRVVDAFFAVLERQGDEILVDSACRKEDNSCAPAAAK